jgi:transcriptional regulator with XRE-family HTH domain
MSLPSPYEPIHIPDWAWQRPETRDLLAKRDVGGLFRLAQQYAGASQSRIAAATGMSQARVNEIVNGHRTVAALDVLLRIADGLHMPDPARITMGLAPTRAETADLTTLSGEIGAVYPNQQPVAEEIRRRARDAQELDVLAVRALGILGLNDSLLRPALAGRVEPLRLRVLLLEPDCPAAVRRAAEIGESHESFAAGIRLALARLREVAEANGVLDVRVRLYERLPVWRVIRLDGVQYVSAFDAAWEGHESAVYEVPRTPRGAFWAGFARLFEDLWDTSTVVIGGQE